jgi:anti-anti-sigma regulatory factor
MPYNWMATAERVQPAVIDRPSITVGRSAGTVVVTVCGELDAKTSKHLGIILADLIDGQGNLSILVDLHEASARDPDCLWILTEAAERAHRRGATMRLDAAAEVTSALQLRGLDVFVGRSADAG